VPHVFHTPNSPRDSEIINELLSRVTNAFDSTTSLRDSEIVNELLSRVKHDFDSPNSPYGLRNNQRTAVTGDAWLRQAKLPLGTHKTSTKSYHG
jgi:hypothetical protein